MTKHTMVERVCEVCNKSFSARLEFVKKGNAKYCSRACFIDSLRVESVTVKCQQCGSEFQANLRDINKGWGRFCSRDCANKAQTISIESLCLKCGKVMYLKPHQIKSGVKYCSEECYRTAKTWIEVPCLKCGNLFSISKSRYEKYGAKYCSNECRNKDKIKQVIRICPICGKEFKKAPSLLHGENSYCSRKCAGRAHSQRTSGEKNYFYRGGTTGYRGSNWKEQRQLAYARDGGICQICGLIEAQSLKKFRSRCQVHHIRPYRSYKREYGRDCYLLANDLKNLITLCRQCHKKAEWGNIVLQPKLL